MKKLLLICAILISTILFGCNQETAPAQKETKDLCGDGICDRIEARTGNCPQDCQLDSEADTKKDSKKHPLYIGIMVHLEGWDDEVDNQIKFQAHAKATREFADIFEKYNAKVTFEARPEFIEAQKNWDDNVLQELQDRGHGIGLHADLGGNADKIGQTQEEFNRVLSNMKKIFERDSGIQIRHVSGICSSLDWAEGAIKAGFEFTTGGVAYCVMSLPEDQRPEEFKNCDNPSVCHDTFPEQVKDRIHPWRISSAKNWLEEDPNGQLVFFAAENAIKGLSEEETGAKTKTFDQKDIEVFMNRLKEALEYVDPNKVNIIYVGWSIGDKDFDEETIDQWMQSLQPYIDSGQVEWKTINQMYDEYLALM